MKPTRLPFCFFFTLFVSVVVIACLGTEFPNHGSVSTALGNIKPGNFMDLTHDASDTVDPLSLWFWSDLQDDYSRFTLDAIWSIRDGARSAWDSVARDPGEGR